MADETTVEQIQQENAQAGVRKSDVEQLREELKKSDWVLGMLGQNKEEAKTEEKKEPEKKEAEGEKKEPETKQEPEAKAGEKKEQEEAKPAPAAKKKTVQRREPPKAPVDVESVAAKAAAEAAARVAAIQQSSRQEEKKPEPDPKTKRQEAIYAKLEELNPNAYRGIGQRMTEFARKEEARAEAWEKENPGKVYDADDEEHQAWYSANQPKIDPDDFEDAKVEVRVQAAESRIQERIKPEVEKVNRRLDEESIKPVEQQAAVAVTSNIFKTFVPEGEMTKKAVEEWRDSDPISFEVASQIDSAYRPVVRVVPKLYRGVVQFDNNDQTHIAARKMVSDMESELADVEPSELEKDGRQWLPISEFYKIPTNQRSRFWCVSEADITNYVALRAANEAKLERDRRVKEFEERASRLGFTKAKASDATQNGQAKPAQTTQQEPQKKQEVSKSPSTGAAPASDGKTGAKQDGSNDPLGPLWSRMGIQA